MFLADSFRADTYRAVYKRDKRVLASIISVWALIVILSAFQAFSPAYEGASAINGFVEQTNITEWIVESFPQNLKISFVPEMIGHVEISRLVANRPLPFAMFTMDESDSRSSPGNNATLVSAGRRGPFTPTMVRTAPGQPKVHGSIVAFVDSDMLVPDPRQLATMCDESGFPVFLFTPRFALACDEKATNWQIFGYSVLANRTIMQADVLNVTENAKSIFYYFRGDIIIGPLFIHSAVLLCVTMFFTTWTFVSCLLSWVYYSFISWIALKVARWTPLARSLVDFDIGCVLHLMWLQVLFINVVSNMFPISSFLTLGVAVMSIFAWSAKFKQEEAPEVPAPPHIHPHQE